MKIYIYNFSECFLTEEVLKLIVFENESFLLMKVKKKLLCNNSNGIHGLHLKITLNCL